MITASVSVLKSWFSEFEDVMTRAGFSSKTFCNPEKEKNFQVLIFDFNKHLKKNRSLK
jgi:hypothetical protein